MEKTHDVTIDYASHNNYFDDFIYVFRQCTLNSPSICKNAYRHNAAKRQTAGIKFTQWPKNSIFALQGLLVAPIYEKFGMSNRQIVSLGREKFRRNRCTGWVLGPQSWKFLLFGKDSPASGVKPWTEVYKFYGIVCAHPHCISMGNV